MKRLLSAILLSQILFIGCYDNHKEPESLGQQQIGTTTIANVYAMCNSSNVVPIKADISIRGVVVSSDSQSFINKAIYIDDGTATAKICINMSQSSSLYPEGARVTVLLKGLVVTIRDYQLHIAVRDSKKPTEIDGIQSEVLLDRHISCEDTPYPLEPQIVQPHQLSSLLCGKLVRVEGMRHSPTSEVDTYIAGGFHRFANLQGDYTYIYIDPYSAAVDKVLPSGEIAITGIVTWHSDIFGDTNAIALLPRYKSDIGM